MSGLAHRVGPVQQQFFDTRDLNALSVKTTRGPIAPLRQAVATQSSTDARSRFGEHGQTWASTLEVNTDVDLVRV